MVKQAKNTICLWYDRDAEEAAQFYAKTFPDSSVGAVYTADEGLHEKLEVFGKTIQADIVAGDAQG